MQLELALPLGAQRDQPRVVRARRDFAEPHLLALHKQLHTKQAQPAQVIGHGLGNLARFFQCRRVHGVRLPAFNIVTGLLNVAHWVAEMRFDLTISPFGAHGQLGDFVIKVDKTFDDHASLGHTATCHGVIPGGCHIGRAVDLALPLAGAAHHGLDHTGVANGWVAITAVNRCLQLRQRVAKAVRAGGQAQGFSRQTANAFAVHRQPRGACGGDAGDNACGFQPLQHRRGNRFNLGHHQIRLDVLNQRLELGGVAHGDGARVVRHLLARRVVIAIHRNRFHAQALQRNQDFFAQFAAAQQHDFGGMGRQRGSKGGHSKSSHSKDVLLDAANPIIIISI